MPRVVDCVAFSPSWGTFISNQNTKITEAVNSCDIGECVHPDVVGEQSGAFCHVFYGGSCRVITPEKSPLATALRQRITEFKANMKQKEEEAFARGEW